MKFKKIVGVMALVVGAAALLASTSAAEETFSHPTFGESPHASRGRENPHRRFREEGFRAEEHRFARRRHHPFSPEGLKAALDLDEGQAEKMRGILREYRKGVILKKARLRVAQIELDAAVADGDFVMADIEKLAKAREAAATALTMVRVHALAGARAVLSETQFKTFMRMVAHRMRGGGHHGRKRDSHHEKRKNPHRDEEAYEEYEEYK